MSSSGLPVKKFFPGRTISDGFVKSPYLVIPAKAGIQNYLILLDPGLRRGDAIREIPAFYEAIIYEAVIFYCP